MLPTFRIACRTCCTSKFVTRVLGKSIIEYGNYPISIRTTLTDSDLQNEKLPESVKEIMDEAKRESDPWFSRISSEFKTESSFKFHTKIILSPLKVSLNIVNCPENTSVDLIVVGTRGRSRSKRLPLDRVASHVVTYTHCPVSVFK